MFLASFSTLAAAQDGDDEDAFEDALEDELEQEQEPQTAWPPRPRTSNPADPDPDPDPDSASASASASDPGSDADAEAEPDTDADADAASATDSDSERDANSSGFAFGSYGRLVAASNLDGGLGRDSDIVAFNPRIDEDVYMELELRREDSWSNGLRSRVVATVAFGGPFFHLDGNFDESIAVRNLFAEVDNALVDGLSLWAGSRMWRGDDVYLLNFWPLDNINTLGGGASYRIGDAADLRFVVGLARLDDPFQRQVSGAIPIDGFIPDEVVILDRPRTTFGLKATYYLFGRTARTGMKAILYGEGHFLPEGRREIEVGITERLPYDSGWVVGGQLGLWQADENTFVNLFFKWSRGLGAYNPLGVPFRAGGTVHDTERAREALIAISANVERGAFGMQVGAYYRNFRDADPSAFERTKLAEGAFNLRPHVWVGEHAGLSFDFSYQALQANQLDERTGQGVRGGVTKLGFIPFYSPFGRGTYTRPHLRLIYSLTIRDQDAQALYPEEDPRSRNKVEHFLGIGAEWWFDSTSYGQ